ncbi:cytochrome b5, partial [Arapaima gigas]
MRSFECGSPATNGRARNCRTRKPGSSTADEKNQQSGNMEEDQTVKYYRLSEVEERNTFRSTWIIINYKIYDVTKFLEE